MYKHTHAIRICYADTDQMGFVYYGNYPRFFEIGRVETIRSLGYTYKSLEDNNIILPVSELKIKYIAPALYDDIINIETTIVTFPDTHKIIFQHKIFNEKNILLCKGEVILYILFKDTKKTTTLPQSLLNILKQYYL